MVPLRGVGLGLLLTGGLDIVLWEFWRPREFGVLMCLLVWVGCLICVVCGVCWGLSSMDGFGFT